MLCSLDDGFLLSLANILTGNAVEDASISKAIEHVCNAARYEHGLVYEADLSGDFTLTGSFSSHPASFPARFYVEDTAPLDYSFLSQNAVTYAEKGPRNTPREQRLLELCSTESMVLAPIPDGNGSLYGFALLRDRASGPSLREEEKPVLSAALSMIVRYVKIRMFQKKLEQSRITMESMLDNTGIDMYVNDFNTHEILYVNKSMAAPYGGREKFMGQKCWATLFPEQTGPCEFCPQSKLIDSRGQPTKVYTWDYQRAFDGAWFRVFSSAFHWVDGRLAHVVSSADITDNKRNEALIENLANYDQLTKLPNRRMLVKECDRRIDSSTVAEQGYLLFFDIDGFKPINDNFGHDAGDEFLVQLGAFFSGIPLLKNAIYRNGGDEFVAIIGGEEITKQDIGNLADFIQKRFKKPWVLTKGKVTCSTSIGVACYPEDGLTTEVLLEKADMAMYRVKKSGGGGVCFGYQLAENTAPSKI